MIDFIKIEKLKTIEPIEENSLLNGLWRFESDQNALIIAETARHRKLTFEKKKFSNTNYYQYGLKGSIHYFKNNGLHNSDDFNLIQLKDTIETIIKDFKIDVSRSILNNLEFGVNVILPFNPDIILNGLVTHKGKKFSFETGSNINYYQCRKSQFTIKVYDKGLQNSSSKNILRFEIKVRKMQYLTKKGIHINTLNDLFNLKNLDALGNLLIEVYNEILMECDVINLHTLNRKDKDVYYKATRPNTWELKNKLPSEKKTLQRLRKRYEDLVKRLSKNDNKKKLVYNLIKDKWRELSIIYPPKPKSNLVHYLPLLYRVNSGQNNYHFLGRPSIH